MGPRPARGTDIRVGVRGRPPGRAREAGEAAKLRRVADARRGEGGGEAGAEGGGGRVVFVAAAGAVVLFGLAGLGEERGYEVGNLLPGAHRRWRRHD